MPSFFSLDTIKVKSPHFINFRKLQVDAHALHLWHCLLGILFLHLALEFDLLLDIFLIHDFLLFSFTFFLALKSGSLHTSCVGILQIFLLNTKTILFGFVLSLKNFKKKYINSLKIKKSLSF